MQQKLHKIWTLDFTIGRVASIWYTLSPVPHVFWILSFLCWSNLLLLNPKDLYTLNIFNMLSHHSLNKYIFLQQNTKKYCVRKTIFMRYWRQSVSKHCTKLTLSALYCKVPNWTLLYCTALHSTVLHCSVLYCNV